MLLTLRSALGMSGSPGPMVVGYASIVGGATTISVTKAAVNASLGNTLTDGDVLIAVHSNDWQTLGAMTAQTGTWANPLALSSVTDGNGGARCKVWTRTASSEPTSWTFGQTASNDAILTIIALRYVDLATAIGAIQQTPSGAARVTPTVDHPGVAGSFMLAGATCDVGASGATFTHPTDMTEIVDLQSTSWTAHSVAYSTNPTDPTGTRTFTCSVATQNSPGVQWAFVLPPASSVTTQQGAVSLSATSSLSVDGVRTTSGAVSLSAGTSLTVQPSQVMVGAVNLAATSVLTSNGTASTPAVDYPGAVSLTAAATITSNGVRSTSGAVTLSITTAISVAALLPLGSVSLTATGILTVAGVRTTSGTVSLSVIGALTANALLVGVAAVTLNATAALSLNALRTTSGTVSLISSAALLADGVRQTTGAVLLSSTPVLTLDPSILSGSGVALAASAVLSVAAQLQARGAVSLTTSQSLSLVPAALVGTVSLSASGNLGVASIRITSASVTLSSVTSLAFGPFLLLGAAVALTSLPVLSLNGIRSTPGAVSLTQVVVFSATGSGALASVTLSAVPILTVAVTVGITNGTAALSVLSSLSAGGIRITNVVAGGVPLVAVYGLNVNGAIGSGGGANLGALGVLSVAGVIVRIGSSQLTVSSALVVGGRLGAFAAIGLVATGGLTTAGSIVRIGAVSLTANVLLGALSSRVGFGSISMVALANLFLIDLFSEVDFGDVGEWTFGGIGVAGRNGEGTHRDVRPTPRTTLDSEWTTAGIHTASAWSS